MNRDDLRRFALAVKAEHSGAAQGCPTCRYFKNPCWARRLAEAVLELLDEGSDKETAYEWIEGLLDEGRTE